MILRNRIGILLAALLLLPASLTFGQNTPNAGNSTAVLGGSHAMVSMVLVPNGQGTALNSCYAYGGIPAGVHIGVLLLDANFTPVVTWPQRDIRLERAASTLTWCADAWYPPPMHAPNCADAAAVAGATAFTLPYHGGGWLAPTAGCYVWVREGTGMFARIPAPVAVGFNSPDINGDLVVNLSDLGFFASDFMTATGAYRSDYYWDGVLNLADLAIFAQHYGATCP